MRILGISINSITELGQNNDIGSVGSIKLAANTPGTSWAVANGQIIKGTPRLLTILQRTANNTSVYTPNITNAPSGFTYFIKIS